MPISTDQRARIARRAGFRCEYCLLSEDHAIKRHEPDHIIPRKHGGGDDDENLAWAFFHCNRHKGSEVGAVDGDTGQLKKLGFEYKNIPVLTSKRFQIAGNNSGARCAYRLVNLQGQ